ncbi:MAG: hypothetical protein Kow009_03600 [Spirochaetales bacterium]
MIFTEKMRKVELLLLKRDIDRVLEYLGIQRCFQVSDTVEKEKGDKYFLYQDLLHKLKASMEFLGLTGSALPLSMKELHGPTETDLALAEKIAGDTTALLDAEKKLLERKLSLESTLQEVRIFQRMNFPLKELENVTYLVYRYGILSPARIPDVQANLQGRAVVFQLDADGRVLILATKKGRFALDTELKKAEFRELELPESAKEFTPRMVEDLEKNLHSVQLELQSLEERKGKLRKIYEGEIPKLYETLEIGYRIEELKGSLEQTEHAFRLAGWVPESFLKKTVSELDSLTEGRIAIRVYEPEELPSVRDGREKIPVRLKHSKFFQSFEGLVFSYGAPLYGSIDPTPIVAVSFTLLFAIMFGDVGQGFLIFLFGVLLGRGSIPRLQNWKKYHVVFKTVGIASMVTGILYGSCFASETLLIPVERILTSLVLGEPQDRFLYIMPTEGIDRMLAFFGFTLALGAILNSLGLIINVYNRIRQKDLHRGIFSKTGLVGALFFWYALALGIRLILFKGSLRSYDLPVLFVLLVLIFWGEPIARWIEGKRPLFPEGFFPFLMEGIVEVLESISYYISNSVSFLRVGAFALSHTVLSLIVFQMAELMHSLPGSLFFQALIILFGNALILVLEGLIVTIQVIRLHYYEFFSKFFTESGTPFKPFDLTQA